MSTTINGITASRWVTGDGEDYDQDTLLSVEVADGARPINVDIDPGKPEVVSVSLSPDEAWRLCRDLARAASAVESAL